MRNAAKQNSGQGKDYQLERRVDELAEEAQC